MYLLIYEHLLGIRGKIEVFALKSLPSSKEDRIYISYLNLCTNEMSPYKCICTEV